MYVACNNVCTIELAANARDLVLWLSAFQIRELVQDVWCLGKVVTKVWILCCVFA